MEKYLPHVGAILFGVGVFFLFSSLVFVIIQSPEWFSRCFAGTICLGLWGIGVFLRDIYTHLRTPEK